MPCKSNTKSTSNVRATRYCEICNRDVVVGTGGDATRPMQLSDAFTSELSARIICKTKCETVSCFPCQSLQPKTRTSGPITSSSPWNFYLVQFTTLSHLHYFHVNTCVAISNCWTTFTSVRHFQECRSLWSGSDYMHMTGQPGRMRVQEPFNGRMMPSPSPYTYNPGHREVNMLPPLRTDFVGGSLSSQAHMGGVGAEYGHSGRGQQL